MELGPRDRLSQAFVHELEKGRTIDTPYGPVVHLDLRHLGAKLIDSKLPFVRELCLKYQNIDPVTELIPVRPVVHYMMGGVHTDIRRRDTAGRPVRRRRGRLRQHQRRQPAGVELAARVLVFGARAGPAAAEYAGRPAAYPAPRSSAQVHDEQRRLERELLGTPTAASRSRTSGPRCSTMENAAGIYRDGRRAGQGRRHAAGAAGPVRRVGHRRPQPHLQHRAGRRARAVVHARRGRGIIACALQREESRGAHQRTDFPARDDQRFLAHSLIHRDPDGERRVEYLPVTITRWPPAERVYGR